MLPGRKPPLAAGIAVAAVAVALTTLLVFALDDVAPVLSLGVVYLLAVLLVAIVWGAWLGIATALASALAFNFFHIPPTGRLTIATGEDWVGLAVFFFAAVSSSWLAQVARSLAAEANQRRQEADLSAEMARLLLRGGRLEEALPPVGQRLAAALGLSSAAIELNPVDAGGRTVVFPLREGSRQIGTLVLSAGEEEAVLKRVQLRVAPALEALLAAALERDALQAEVVETAALRRSDVIKTALLRAVSHDLRSPLTAVLTAAEALRSPSITEDERRELAQAVIEEATRLSRLIDNLLDLSRLEADAAEPRPEWSSLEEVIGAAIDDLALPEGTFRLAVDGRLPPVRADAAQLERAFANLLDNAHRHSGGHPVSVRARDVGGRILIRVVDRGPGIPQAQRDRIFEPFYRSGTDRTGHRGSGLGLAIVRGFVEANGGRVWVESLPNQATSFVVELPIEPASPESEPASPPAGPGRGGAGS
ncbi:sensor histidine kinase [Candidatus Solirubrobacter pratensis]|uniref:sensor histidine kinase n=1 Tax=Candidatus Solirubrobacter pratensis TaxID=1298857 RepID=UPI0018CAD8D3|nr:ATP-binding protein [Candidatus Solirubrobacter pratensis]